MINSVGASTPGNGIPPLPAVNTPLNTQATASPFGSQSASPFGQTSSVGAALGAQSQTAGNTGSGLPGVLPSTATSSPTQTGLTAADGTTGTGGTSGTGSTDGTSASTQDLSGTDTFLKLLVAQLQNQDPSQPMDDQSFITELAQFNTVEQMINLKQSVDAQVASQQASEGVALLGQSITYSIPGIGGNDSTTGQGTVSGVSLQGGQVMLQVGTQTVPLNQVLTVAGSTASSNLSPSSSALPATGALPSMTPAAGMLPSTTPATGTTPSVTSTNGTASSTGVTPPITAPAGGYAPTATAGGYAPTATAGTLAPGALPYIMPPAGMLPFAPSAGTLPFTPSMGTLPFTPSTGTLPSGSSG